MTIQAMLLLALAQPLVSQQPVVLHVAVWDPQSREAERAVQSVCSGFRLHRPDVQVAVFRQPSTDAHGLVMRWCHKATPWRPDVVVVPDLWLPEVADEIEPLGKPAEARLRSLAHRSLLARMGAGAQLSAVPWWMEPRLLYYWPKLVRQSSWQPVSWDQVLDAAKEARERRRVWGLGVPGSGLELCQLYGDILWSLDGGLVGSGGDVDLMNPKAEEALDVLVRADREGLAEPEMLTWSQTELEDLFADGKLAVLAAPLGFEALLIAARRDGYGVAQLPGRPVFGSLVCNCLVAFRGSPAAAEAQALLEFVLSAEGQARLAEAGGLPVDRGLAQRVARTPAFRAALLGMDNIRGLPLGQWRALAAAVERAAYLAVSGRMTAPRALEEGQTLLPARLED